MLRHPPVVISTGTTGTQPARSAAKSCHGLGSDDDDALNHAFGSRCNVALILIAKMVEFECGRFALHYLEPSYSTTQRGQPPRRHEASRCFAASSSVHASDAPTPFPFPVPLFLCRRQPWRSTHRSISPPFSRRLRSSPLTPVLPRLLIFYSLPYPIPPLDP